MRRNISTLWTLICYPSDDDVIIIVCWTLLYMLQLPVCYISFSFLFAWLLSCFSDE